MPRYTMNYTKGHGGRLKRAYTPKLAGYSELEAILTRFNIKRYNADGQLDVALSNEDRLNFAVQHFPPIIFEGGVLYYRHMQKGEHGLWQVEYKVSRPAILAAISGKEYVTFEAASSFLRIDADKLNELARQRELRRKGSHIYFDGLLRHEPANP